MEKPARYLTFRQRLWLVVGVLLLLAGGGALLARAHDLTDFVAFAALFVLSEVVWLTWWIQRVGEVVTRAEQKHRYAVELLARPFWILVPLNALWVGTFPFVPLLYGKPAILEMLSVWLPLAIPIGWVITMIQRREALAWLRPS